MHAITRRIFYGISLLRLHALFWVERFFFSPKSSYIRRCYLSVPFRKLVLLNPYGKTDQTTVNCMPYLLKHIEEHHHRQTEPYFLSAVQKRVDNFNICALHMRLWANANVSEEDRRTVWLVNWKWICVRVRVMIGFEANCVHIVYAVCSVVCWKN